MKDPDQTGRDEDRDFRFQFQFKASFVSQLNLDLCAVVEANVQADQAAQGDESPDAPWPRRVSIAVASHVELMGAHVKGRRAVGRVLAGCQGFSAVAECGQAVETPAT